MTKVQLTKPHTHAGTTYQPDDVISVSDADAKWLAEHDVIQKGNAKPRWLKPVPDADTPASTEDL